ncbi:hypothetical protein ACS0TY_013292 [Phlomoides rotata]
MSDALIKTFSKFVSQIRHHIRKELLAEIPRSDGLINSTVSTLPRGGEATPTTETSGAPSVQEGYENIIVEFPPIPNPNPLIYMGYSGDKRGTPQRILASHQFLDLWTSVEAVVLPRLKGPQLLISLWETLFPLHQPMFLFLKESLVKASRALQNFWVYRTLCSLRAGGEFLARHYHEAIDAIGRNGTPHHDKDEQVISESALNKLVGVVDMYNLNEMEPPETLAFSLRPYQKQALYWMSEIGERCKCRRNRED